MPVVRKHRRPGHPDGALYLAGYAKLQEYLRAFARGHLNLLILVGEPGIAKTRTGARALGNRVCWIEGNATPFGMYEKLYRHRDQDVVIDDVDSLYADRSGIRLLKCLCQTEEEKSVAWHSDARSLERHRIPREFTTRSSVIIICNDWKTLNRNVAALQDRGHVLVFQPSAAELHAQAGKWFDDDEIYDWFGANLHRMHEPSFRHYVRARTEGGGNGLDGGAGRGRREPPGAAGGGDSGQRCLREHRGKGTGIRAARRRLPGDVLQLPAASVRRSAMTAGRNQRPLVLIFGDPPRGGAVARRPGLPGRGITKEADGADHGESMAGVQSRGEGR